MHLRCLHVRSNGLPLQSNIVALAGKRCRAPISQNISRRDAVDVCPCREGPNHGKDDLVTERTSAIRPTSDCSPDTSAGQLSVGSATASPGDDSPLLALERQFNAISAELLAVERLRCDQKRYHDPAAQSPERSTIESCIGAHTHDAVTEQIESVLARLHPIERAIMQTSGTHVGRIERESAPRGLCNITVLGSAYR